MSNLSVSDKHIIMHRQAKYSVFGNYLDTMDAVGYVSVAWLGDVSKFCQHNRYSPVKFGVNLGFGDEGCYLITTLSFSYDYDEQQPQIIQAECDITGEVGQCYKYRYRIQRRDYFDSRIWIPHVSIGATVRYEGATYTVSRAQGNSDVPYSVRYGLRGEPFRKMIPPHDLELLAEDGNFYAVMRYAKGRDNISPPARMVDGGLSAHWNIYFPQRHFCHKWAIGYAQSNQALQLPLITESDNQ